MASWRDSILREFTPQVARLTLVADPDVLLLEEGLLEAIEERGFELIPFDDHVAFRYAYESRFRSRWDRGEMTDLVVVLRAAIADLGSLPFDLLQAGRRLAFNLGDLFPNLSYPIVAALDRGDLDAVYEAQSRHAPGRMGDNGTKDFVLRHVFGVAPELVKQPPDLLRSLLHRHHPGLRWPRVLDERFIEVLRQNGVFEDWPLESIVPDRAAFFAFLQERWPIFLDRLAASHGVSWEPAAVEYELGLPGPGELPFDHDDVRVYVDNLFVEGMLDPVPHPRAERLVDSWAAFGIRIDPDGDDRRRWDSLLAAVSDGVPGPDARHQDWQAFAPKWGQLIALRHRLPDGGDEERIAGFEELVARVDAEFGEWIERRYATLHNLAQPVMVHHIGRLLTHRLAESREARGALLVMDGMSVDQWAVIQDVLRAQRPDFRLQEGTVFAWIPTLTSVSRQACFAGRPPLYFPESIHTTGKEPGAWSRFWEDEGFTAAEVGYVKSIGEPADLERVDDLISHPKMRAAGIVVDKVDRIMHGMELGTAGMHNQVRQWAEQGLLADILDRLLGRGFIVYLTADHGNIETTGCGRPSEGSIADVRGERVRVFPDASLRSRIQERFPDAIAWPPTGLPNDYLPLLAPGRRAFVREGDRLVSHGGITVEEVIVPFVEIERNRA